MIDDYSKFNAIHYTAMEVFKELPEWAAEWTNSVPKTANGRNPEQDTITFTYCPSPYCDGWVPKPASETDYATATPPGAVPKRPAGTAYYCPRCGTEIAFKEK